MKIEWLVTDVTSAESPVRAEPGFFGLILDVFWPIQATFVVGEPFCDVGMANSGRICGQGAMLRRRNPLFEY